MNDNSPKLNAALGYTQELSWPVFPCHTILENSQCSCGQPDCSSPGKHPLTENGFKNATRDEATIQVWWAESPDANIGIPTGMESGFDVLDVDPRHGGEESLEELEAEHGRLPDTVEQITGAGGRHVLFNHRDGVRNKTGMRPGLDVRGEGGYIVVAPSVHETGRTYEWEADGRPEEVELADCPEWLLKLLQSTDGQRKKPAPTADDDIPEGERNTTLASLAGTMRNRGMGKASIAAALLVENEHRCKPPLPKEEVRQIATSIARYEPAESSAKFTNKTRVQPLLRCMADVMPEVVEWISNLRIPRRHLTGLEGDPGEGKSFITQALATMLSKGKGLPGTEPIEPCNSLLLTAEDHLPTTVRPRLDAMGADVKRIFAYGEPFTLDPSGLNHLETLINSTSSRLVLIDPIVAFLAVTVDMYRANEVRPIMAALADIADRTNSAIVIVRHLAKGNSPKAIYRGLGSIDFTAACRSVLLAGHDPNDPNSRALVHIKSNLGPLAEPLGFSLDKGQFQWTDSTSLTASQILSAEVANSPLMVAKDFLLEVLSNGPQASIEVETEAKMEGISRATLRRAKKALGVQAYKEGKEWLCKIP